MGKRNKTSDGVCSITLHSLLQTFDFKYQHTINVIT